MARKKMTEEERREKNRIRLREWRKKNPEKWRAQVKRRSKRIDKKKKREADRRHYQKNREKICQRQKEYVKKNPEKKKAYDDAWYQKNKAAVKEYQTINRDRLEQKRIERLYGIEGEKFQELLKACKGKCPVCKRPFNKVARRPCIDHCHHSQMIRGIICGACNLCEGHLGTPENAYRLYEYMASNALFYANLKQSVGQEHSSQVSTT
jgi:hypothetical protein